MSSQIQIYMHGISVGDQLSIDRKKLTWDYNSSASILSLIIIENSHLSHNQSDAYLIQQCFTLNPLHRKIIMHILHTVLYPFLMVLTWRIYSTIKSFSGG